MASRTPTVDLPTPGIPIKTRFRPRLEKETSRAFIGETLPERSFDIVDLTLNRRVVRELPATPPIAYSCDVFVFAMHFKSREKDLILRSGSREGSDGRAASVLT